MLAVKMIFLSSQAGLIYYNSPPVSQSIAGIWSDNRVPQGIGGSECVECFSNKEKNKKKSIIFLILNMQ